jgi:hypothetical protein
MARKRSNQKEPKMPEKEIKESPAAQEKTADKPAPQRMAVRLVPVDNSDQPIFANYTSLNVASGMVLLDFGFLEPTVMTAIQRAAKSGGKVPATLNGKLAVRVALGPEALRGLSMQLAQLLRQSAAGRKTN